MPSVGTGSQPRRMASFSSSRLKWKFKDRTIEEIGTSHSHKLIRWLGKEQEQKQDQEPNQEEEETFN